MGLMHRVVAPFWRVGIGAPVAPVPRRNGYSRWLVGRAFVPLVDPVAPWARACAKWPGERASGPAW
ncbi:hypothetical protein LZK98_17200 [Sphingomonas cannabina]|uniref:hypothetical protein n=1 Tax=Sphingomonas cannabina TaxID=2899123 RepID=UPI001F36927A|nr:hypothetical protein [Sphingomonas cannabina]UIJ44772.1 hypothetical protein LZK98_17200 [Sphingomonas cannabina]